jgi:hypothetical protein
MAALTQNVSRRNSGSNIPPDTFTAANNQVFYQGSVVLIKSDGLAYVGVAYSTASGGTCPGYALFELDTTITANQGRSVVVQPGTFGDFDNSGIAACSDPSSRLTQVFFEDDNTVSATNQGGTLTGGARLHSISADGLTVVVQFEVLR